MSKERSISLLQRFQEAAEKERAHLESVGKCIDSKESLRGQNLRILRTFFDVSQAHISSLIGCTQRDVSSYERGESILYPHAARELEKSLGLPELWLDRDNLSSLLFTGNESFELIKRLEGCSADAIKAVSRMVELLKAEDNQC